jgi:hypothetical protein
MKLFCKIITRTLLQDVMFLLTFNTNKKKKENETLNICEIFVTYIGDENRQKNYKFLQTMNSWEFCSWTWLFVDLKFFQRYLPLAMSTNTQNPFLIIWNQSNISSQYKHEKDRKIQNMMLNCIKKMWNREYLDKTKMILVGWGFIVVVVSCEVKLLCGGGAHGGPRKISGQHSWEKDQEEPKRTHFFQFQGNKLMKSKEANCIMYVCVMR